MPEVFEICSEDDLFDAVKNLESGSWYQDQHIQFVGWPRYQVRLRGDDFSGGIPTRMFQPLAGLQRTIDRAYARTVYGKDRKLSDAEKEKTELIVYLEHGSSIFNTDLTEVLNTMAGKAVGKMTGPQITATVLGVAAIVATSYATVAYINSEAAEKEVDYKIRVSEEDTKRYEIIANLAKTNAELNEQLADTIAAQAQLMRKLKDTDELYVDNKYLIDGQTYKDIQRGAKKEKSYDRLDGNFMILAVESGGIDYGYRVKVKNVADGHELFVQIPQGTLDQSRQKELQAGEWDKKPVEMQINIAKIGDKIVSATLIDEGLALPF
ncbi:hypothetical protein [Pseudovibrio sp. Alg231-02]|uniref:hypothetical protein n=1 Tax=Pseudovibrio sp. Alg231-02 TaxID=1922223 RepID=UPI000D556739|nr:hypothetical protein [Pseudovibrio sp. Alg231-02]